jgi:hypothetical protein
MIAAAWIFVSLPLAWGLYQSVMKSKPLFVHADSKAPAASAPSH